MHNIKIKEKNLSYRLHTKNFWIITDFSLAKIYGKDSDIMFLRF